MLNSLYRKGDIPISIWAIGCASMLINISTVLVFGIAALYLKQILAIGTGLIMFLEGFFEACAYIMKLISGVISDYFKRRKSLMILGFAMITIARPILAFFGTFSAVLVARVFDRFGNGIQSSPRDALVGDLAPLGKRGACFGLRQSLAVAGSFIGGIVGIIAMDYTNNNYQQIFMLACVPAFLALILLLVFVEEAPINPESASHKKKPARRKMQFSDLALLGKRYWLLMFIAVLFMMARLGESVLIIHATESYGMKANWVHGIMVLYNGSNALCSYPIGVLSDRLGRIKFLMLSFSLLVIADGFLAFSPNLWLMLIGVVIWGIQIGMSQSMFLSIIADYVPEELRGTGIGFYYLASSLGLIAAGSIGGEIAYFYNQKATYVYSGFMGLTALTLLFLLRHKLQPQHASK